jgi:hypothetical protein
MSTAWAQACPGVCIGFAPAAGSVQAVPLSPEAMGLLALLVAAAGYWALRQKSQALMSLLLASAVGITGMALDMRQAIAAAAYTVVLAAGSNSALVAVPDFLEGFVDVQNTLATAVTITSISVKGTVLLVSSSPL